MRRPSISLEQLVKIGSSLLNRKGLTEFALKDVAHEVGMRLPSLYNYIESREHLLMLIAEDTAKRFYQLLSTASQEGDGTEKIRQVAEAYLNFAWDSPGEYELMQAPIFWCKSSAEPVFESIFELVRQLTGDWRLAPEVETHFYRSLRSFLHGFADIGRQQGFRRPQALESSAQFGLDLLLAGWQDYLAKQDSISR